MSPTPADSRGSSDPRSPLHRAGEFFARTDASDTAVRAARLARRLVPSEPDPVRPDSAADKVARYLGDDPARRPSAVRELGIASVGIWQNLVERRRHSTSQTPVQATILFTDLVGFSSWALRAGDDQVLDLLGQVNTATARVIRHRGGQVVKTLGDGTMAVFVDAGQAIEAAYECGEAVSAVTVGGHRPALRSGVHTGSPRAVGDDFLGVDVNIAARVCDGAGAGEVYASETTLEGVDTHHYVVRKRRFRAKGVPRDLSVFRVLPRYDEDGRRGVDSERG